MKDQIEVHKATGRSTPGVKAAKSTASSCRFSNAETSQTLHEPKSNADTHTPAASALHTAEGKDCEGERASVDGARPFLSGGTHAEDTTAHAPSREAKGTAAASSAGDDFAEGNGLRKDDRQTSPDYHGTDPLISMHDFGEGGLPDGLYVALSDEQGGNDISELNMPMTMPEWGDGQGIGDIEYGDIFEDPDSHPNLLEATFPAEDHHR